VDRALVLVTVAEAAFEWGCSEVFAGLFAEPAGPAFVFETAFGLVVWLSVLAVFGVPGMETLTGV
jgi:hypothetical protein